MNLLKKELIKISEEESFKKFFKIKIFETLSIANKMNIEINKYNFSICLFYINEQSK